jgi:hypothetical protein
MAQGSLTGIVINPSSGTTGTVTLDLNPDRMLENGTGTFSWNISIGNMPAGITVTAATMTITPRGGSSQPPLNLLTSGNLISSRNLSSGIYNIRFDLTRSDSKQVVWMEILHVYLGLTSPGSLNFTNAHFSGAYNIIFNYNDGRPNLLQSVLHNAAANSYTPSRSGWLFDAWYTDNNTFNNAYNFSDPVFRDTTLFARWRGNLNTANVNVSGGPFTYTGSALTPLVSVTLADGSLVAAANYSVSYSGNTDAGTASVTVNPALGNDNYTGTRTTTFTINPQAISSVAITGLVEPVVGTTPNNTITVAGTPAAAGVGATLSWLTSDGIPVTGNFLPFTMYTATVSLTRTNLNYTFPYPFTASINGISVTPSVISDGSSATLTRQFTTGAAPPVLGGTVSIKVQDPMGEDGDWTDPCVGETLAANIGSLENSTGTVIYQWLRDGEPITLNGTNQSYILVTGDAGSSVSVRVSTTGNSGTVTSSGLLVSAIPDGNNTNPFRIYNAGQLGEVGRGTGAYVNWTRERNYRLMRNIILSGEWTPIGPAEATAFTGTFNGGGFEISGLNVTSGTNSGLFGVVGVSGTVRNLGVSGSVTSVGRYSGGIVGWNQGLVQNSYTLVTVINNNDNFSYVGGVVGYNDGGTVDFCYAMGNVTGSTVPSHDVGGVAGRNEAGILPTRPGIVRNCVALNANILGNSFGRVVGDNSSQLTNNHARANMQMGGNPHTWTAGPATVNGANVSDTEPNGGFNSLAFWQNTMGWNFADIWDWDGNMPTLRKHIQ